MQRLADRSRHGVPAALLTPVQRQIVGMLADGSTNQAILWRLGLTSRSEIALWALKQECDTHTH
jgi:DNA-binding CsgD family transcriptional regulator